MGSPSIWMSTVGGSRSVLCTVQWETTACNGFTIPVGKPAGTITRSWIDAMRAGGRSALRYSAWTARARATQAVTVEVSPCVIGHTGRQRDHEQLDGSRSLVGSANSERLVDPHLVAVRRPVSALRWQCDRGGRHPVGCWTRLADAMQGRHRVTACFFGDGAVAEGAFHEAANLAALWRLPVLFCCENNLYAMGTALSRSQSQTSLALKASVYEIPAWQVDGMDVGAGRRDPSCDRTRSRRWGEAKASVTPNMATAEASRSTPARLGL